MARDEFKKSDITILRARVASRCSNPNCRVPTTSAASERSFNNIGVAAHIRAASPGGPRYNSLMTSKERKSLENAIWLCSNCSIEIDRDETLYPVSLLLEWKREAERRSRVELGKKLPNEEDAVNTLAMALNGYPKNFIASAISNVHKASGQALEALDSRFQVVTHHTNDTTLVDIKAREDVSVRMTVDSLESERFEKMYRALLDHGREVEIGSDAISIDGSPLIEKVMNGDVGVLNISPVKRRAQQKTWLQDNSGAGSMHFDDIEGFMFGGAKSFTFEGHACSGIVNFKSKIPKDSSSQSNLSVRIDLSKWKGCELNELPYFNRILEFFDKLAKGWKLFISLETLGEPIFESEGLELREQSFVLKTASLLNYIKFSREIIKRLDKKVAFPSQISYTPQEHKRLREIAEVIAGPVVVNAEGVSGNASCEIEVDSDFSNVRNLLESKTPSTVRFKESHGESIQIFGEPVSIPPRTYTLESVLPKVSVKIEDLRPGDHIQVEWLPCDDFRYLISLE